MTLNQTTLPQIPDISRSNADPVTKQILSVMKEILEVGVGTRGDAVDSFVTLRQLGYAGLDSLAFDKGSALVYTLSDYASTGSNADNPGIPTNFVVTNQVFANKLTWVNPPDEDFAHVEVWVSVDVDDRSNAYVCGLVAGQPGEPGQFVHSGISTRSNYYYWIRAADRNYNYSGFNPTAATAGEEILADTRATINELLEELTDESRYINTYQIIADAFMVSQPIDTFDAWETGTVYAEDDYVQNDSAAYICILGHTSGAASEPGVGGSWTTYWDLIDSNVYDGTGINVFTIGNIDGNPTVGIRGDLFVDGGIIARMIAVDAIEADHIKAGAVVLSEASGTLDDIIDGLTWGRVSLTAISSGKILLTSGTGVTGTLPIGNMDSIVSGWQYGATTYIDGGDIYTGTVTAAKISVTNLSAINADMGTITAGNITLNSSGFICTSGKTSFTDTDAGFFLGYYSGSYVFNIGDDTDWLKWDGSKLYKSGESGTEATDSVTGLTIQASGTVWVATGVIDSTSPWGSASNYTFQGRAQASGGTRDAGHDIILWDCRVDLIHATGFETGGPNTVSYQGETWSRNELGLQIDFIRMNGISASDKITDVNWSIMRL